MIKKNIRLKLPMIQSIQFSKVFKKLNQVNSMEDHG